MLLPHIAAVLLGVGALIGAYMATVRLRGRPLKIGIAIVHGLFVAPGTITLLYAVVIHGRVQSRGDVSRFDQPSEVQFAIACAIFLAAAMGGMYMFQRHVRRKTVPKWLVLGHGLVALSGYALLMYAIISAGPQGPMPAP